MSQKYMHCHVFMILPFNIEDIAKGSTAEDPLP